MPYDSYLTNINDKSAVIFDFGSAFTKLGFSGECSPRAIIPSFVKKDKIIKYLCEAEAEEEEKNLLISFLYEIYYRKLLVNPKDRRVVILESILSPSKKRDLLANVLFKYFEVPSILFAPIHLVALFTLGLQSGLVVDCGHKEAAIIPVFEGYHLIQNWQAASLGSVRIERRLASIIQESGTIIDSKNNTINVKDVEDVNSLLSREVLEDIKVRSCVVSPLERADKWKQWMSTRNSDQRPPVMQESFAYNMHSDKLGDICVMIPIEARELGPECLFDDENEEITLTKLVLDAIISSPIDCRRVFCDNIVVIGGTSQLPGFKSRLLAEMRRVCKTDKYKKLSHEVFKMHDPPSLANYTAWLGGAIFGELDTIVVRSISRESYLENGKVSDWTDYKSR